MENRINKYLTIKELRSFTGMSQVEFADFLHIPLNNIKNWESTKKENHRECKKYIIELIEFKLTSLEMLDKVKLEEYKKKKNYY